MTPSPEVTPEYRAARSVLLDALTALTPFLDSVVLVGAQAVYERTGETSVPGITTTTDGDLAIDTGLLVTEPELTSVLTSAGFSQRSRQPGSWATPDGVAVDVMVVPHQANRSAGRRAAHVPPHHSFARITPGLEPALIDWSYVVLRSLDASDSRTVTVRTAGPAALLVAKLTKIGERTAEVRAGRRDRRVTKDALDALRLLVSTPTEDLVTGLGRHLADESARAVTEQAVALLGHDARLGLRGPVAALIAADGSATPTTVAQWQALVDDLLDMIEDG